MPSATCTTCIAVWPARSSTIMLSCFGSRCWINTKAMPQFAGKAVNNFLNVSRPPAEAPRATTGKSILVCLENACSFGCGRVWPVCRGLRAVIVVAFVGPASIRETRATQSHLITSAARAQLKLDLKCCRSLRRAGTGVGTLRTLATPCPSCASYKCHRRRRPAANETLVDCKRVRRHRTSRPSRQALADLG